MCEPATALAAASFVTTAGSAVLGHKAQAKQAKDNKQSAIDAMREMSKDIAVRMQQETDSTAQSVFQMDRQARAAAAMGNVSAAAAGVTGNSVAALLDDFEGDLGLAKTAASKNLDMTLAQLGRERISGQTVAQSRINSVASPNPWLTGLQVGAAGLNTLAAWEPRMKPTTGGKNGP